MEHPPVNAWLGEAERKALNLPLISARDGILVSLTILKSLPYCLPTLPIFSSDALYRPGEVPDLETVVSALRQSVRDPKYNDCDVFEDGLGNTNLTVSDFSKWFLADLYEEYDTSKFVIAVLDHPLHLFYPNCKPPYRASGDLLKECGVWLVNRDEFRMVASMRGYCTPAHVDQMCMPQLVHHIHGHKLWFTWPLTVSNLALARTNILLDRGKICDGKIPLALKVLESLSVTRPQPGDCFYIGPSVIHACISLDPCIHVSRNALHPQFREEILRVAEAMIALEEIAFNGARSVPPALPLRSELVALDAHVLRSLVAGLDASFPLIRTLAKGSIDQKTYRSQLGSLCERLKKLLLDEKVDLDTAVYRDFSKAIKHVDTRGKS